MCQELKSVLLYSHMVAVNLTLQKRKQETQKRLNATIRSGIQSPTLPASSCLQHNDIR